MLDKEIVKHYKRSTLMSLSLGIDPEIMIEIMKDAAKDTEDPDGLEIAEGIKQALTLYKNASAHYCKIKPYNI